MPQYPSWDHMVIQIGRDLSKLGRPTFQPPPFEAGYGERPAKGARCF